MKKASPRNVIAIPVPTKPGNNSSLASQAKQVYLTNTNLSVRQAEILMQTRSMNKDRNPEGKGMPPLRQGWIR